MRFRIGKGGLVAAAFAIVVMALPATANAVLSGTNGNIVIISGRGEPNDNTANLYLRPAIGGTAAGTATPIATATGNLQHRHPTWSPDRTHIAYAYGDQPTANFDIYTLDLTDPNATPQNITNSNNVTDDRPAWSPDGTRIAFESENTDASGQINIKIYDVDTGNIVNFTDTGAGTYEHKPAWTPDSTTLFYTVGNPTVANSMDVVRRPSAGGTQQNVAAAPGVSEFQPSISPDGTEMCFTRGAGFDSSARVIYALANGGGQTELPGNAGVAGYNCTWSPDGTKIAYVQGIFTSGDLVVENSDLTIGLLTLENTMSRFDGNPDWAPDGRPVCEDVTVETTINNPVSVPLVCEDTGPEYERTSVDVDIPNDSLPTNGTVSDTNPQPAPATVTYTPNADFRGSDSFEMIAIDFAFGTERATATVNVVPASNEFSLGKAKKNKRKGTAKLAVNVPGPGDLQLATTGKLKGAQKRVDAGGGTTLKLKPKGNAKRKLASRGKARVKAKVTYTPDNGDPNTKTKRVMLKRR